MKLSIHTRLLYLLAMLVTMAAAAPLANPKANEYKSEDCSGDMNFEHHSLKLEHVTMDDTSNSVYLASPNFAWYAYSEKTKDGGKCTGMLLTMLPDGCNDLNEAASGIRIECVLWSRG